MAHSFGKASLVKLGTLHKDLQTVLNVAIQQCEVDFTITEGYRPPEKQFEYYKKGRKLGTDGKWIVVNPKGIITNVDGYKVKGNHNYNPSLAVDIAVFVPNKPGLTYDLAHLSYIAGSIMRIADSLYEKGDITHKIRWGGDWNFNGDFSDSRLPDKPHFELITK